MARKKANNRMLVILLALIAVVCVALWYADKVEREGKAAAAAEQPADEAAEAAAATLAGEGAEALRGQIGQDFPQCELEMRAGGQPLYYYLFSVE